MAIQLAFQTPNIPTLEYVADASTTFTLGNLVYRDTSTGELKEATNSAGTVLNIEGITNKTETTGSGVQRIKITPIVPGALVIVDTTNDTAADQLNKAHGMTNAGEVNNTNTQLSTTLGVFMAVNTVGAASNRKLLGYFIKIGQVTA